MSKITSVLLASRSSLTRIYRLYKARLTSSASPRLADVAELGPRTHPPRVSSVSRGNGNRFAVHAGSGGVSGRRTRHDRSSSSRGLAGLGALDRDAAAAFRPGVARSAARRRTAWRSRGRSSTAVPVEVARTGRARRGARRGARAPEGVRTTGSASRCSGTRCCMGDRGQKRWFLPRVLSGEDRWCQGYSEPGSGSDLASLVDPGRAARRRWVINGQKVWTSLAHEANWVFVLTRTDPDCAATPRHQLLALPARSARRRDPSYRDDQRRARVLRGVFHGRLRRPRTTSSVR